MATSSTKERVEKSLDDYVGTEDPLNLYKLLKGRLKNSFGFSEEKASKYAWFCQLIYKELKDNHDVEDGLKKIASANQLLPEAMAMDLVKSAGAIKNYRLSAGVSVVAPFIDRLAAIAKASGIELNECSLSVVKVALDIAGAGTGAVTSVSGIGIPLLCLSILATFNDSYGLVNACTSKN
jgi:hypothetical protein